jgi:hypothetical protein
MDLARLKTELENRTGARIALYAWQQSPAEEAWGTVTVDGEAAAIWGDGHQQAQALEGSVHLFVRTLTSGAPAGVQAAFDVLGISWRLDDVLYEQETRLLHYVWTWQDWGLV